MASSTNPEVGHAQIHWTVEQNEAIASLLVQTYKQETGRNLYVINSLTDLVLFYDSTQTIVDDETLAKLDGSISQSSNAGDRVFLDEKVGKLAFIPLGFCFAVQPTGLNVYTESFLKFVVDESLMESLHTEWFLSQSTKQERIAHLTNITSRRETQLNAKIQEIVDYITSKNSQNNVVCLAGESAAGKSCVAEMLQKTLEGCGFDSVILAMDNYYLPREKIPILPDGSMDFEGIEALDIDDLQNDITKLLNGEYILSKKYGFSGEADKYVERVQLTGQKVVIVEGLNALHSDFLKRLTNSEVIPVFCTVLAPLILDNSHPFPASDYRLIRRLIRDKRVRSAPFEETMEFMPSVRRGEYNYILPALHNAEFFINSPSPLELCTYANQIADLEANNQVLPNKDLNRVLHLLKLFKL